MTATTMTQRRISGFFVLIAVALILASVALFVWNQSNSPFKTWILVGELAMLFCVSVMPFLLGSFGLGLDISLVFFVFSSIFVISGFKADYYTTPLSGTQIAELSLSECMKNRVEYRIKTTGPINREDVMAVKETCDFVAKTKTENYQAEKELAAQQRKKAEDDQLTALGALRN